MNTEFRKSLRTILVLMDLIAINLAWLIMYLYFSTAELNESNSIFYSFAFFANILWISISFAVGLYDEQAINTIDFFSQKKVYSRIVYNYFVCLYIVIYVIT